MLWVCDVLDEFLNFFEEVVVFSILQGWLRSVCGGEHESVVDDFPSDTSEVFKGDDEEVHFLFVGEVGS